jgi:hypothetical protein
MAEEVMVISVKEILQRLGIGILVLLLLVGIVMLFVAMPYLLVGIGFLLVSYLIGSIIKMYWDYKRGRTD